MKVELLPGIHLGVAGYFNFGHQIDCNVYLVKGATRTVLIDAGSGFESETLLANLEAYGCRPSDIDLILLTHSHWDHARGCGDLLDRGVRAVAVHSSGAEALTVGPKWYQFGMGGSRVEPDPIVTFTPLAQVETFEDGDVFDLGGRALRVLHTPGHSADCVCFVLEENGRRYAFTGDTVSAFATTGMLTADTNLHHYRDSVKAIDALKLDGMFPGHGLWVMRYAAEHVTPLAEMLSSTWAGFSPMVQQPWSPRLDRNPSDDGSP